MAYVGKTNWVDGEVVKDVDLNRIEQGITGVDTGKEALVKNASTKATPVDADSLVLVDSAFSSTTKRVLWSSVKTTLKTWLDTLYSAIVEYDILGSLTNEVTNIKLLGAGGKVLTESTVYIPVIDSVTCKHTIPVKEEA